MCNYHSEEGVDIVEVGIFSPGNDLATFQVNGFKCGIEICYDVHFEELAKAYRRSGELIELALQYDFYSAITNTKEALNH